MAIPPITGARLAMWLFVIGLAGVLIWGAVFD